MQPPSSTERDQCLDAETLAAYVDGLLAHDAIERADRHIDHCRSCRGELSALAAATSFPVGSASPPIPDLDDMPIVEGTLGRYQVEREIGRGNMGVVVRAYDPELARAVAIKILAPKWAHGRDARERLRREAQAMARLSHPNVVQVYDVTSQGELLAIAMELVEGSTLRAAILAGKSWQDLLAICIAAGRGLAAAHAAKLIHRDFKPENVLCTADRVLVSDFGLARLDEVAPAIPPESSATTTTLAGTPAYIAPELLRGEPASIASDQFSFCVATYEALYGERPFAGATLDELRARMTAGDVRAASSSAIPPAIRAALVRGLSPDPSKRFASMELLLDALEPPAPRRPLRFVIGAAALGAIFAIGFVLLRASAPSCDVSAFAWDRDGLSRALAGNADGPRVMASIEGYVQSWQAARREACEATHVRKELSERVLDARNACLDRGRRELVELTALLARDPSLAPRAVEAIGKLHDPQSCTPDLAKPTSDPDLDRAFALLAAGRTQDAVDAGQRILARAKTPAIRAEAMLLVGRAEGLLEHFDIAEKLLNDAVNLAEQARAGQLVATIWVELVQITGAQNHRFEAAQANMRAAEAAFARVDPGPALRVRYEYVVGVMLLARGTLPESREHLDRALVALGASRPAERGIVHGALCDLYRQQREIAKAREHCKAAVDLLVASYGPDHQKIGVMYNVWGTVELADNKHDAAREKWARAIQIFETRHLENDRGLALALSNTAVSWSEQGDPAKARPLHERARDLFAKYHPNHVQRTLPLQGLASVALELKDYRGAIAAYEESLGIVEQVYGKEDQRRAITLYNLALAYQRLPDLDKAVELADQIIVQSEHPGREDWMMVAYALDLQAGIAEKKSKDWKRAIALRERGLAALDHKDIPELRAWLRHEIGRVKRSAGQIAQSIPDLEFSVAYHTKDRTDLYITGTAEYWLAKSLWETGGDRKRALELARAAKVDLDTVKTGMNLEIHRKQVADWLAKHQ